MGKLIFLWIFTTIPLFAQWDIINEIPKTRPIPGLYYDGKIAIACADSLIYTSEDHGKTWIESSKIDTVDYIYTAAVYNDILFVGTVIDGVYATSDKGKTWNAINEGLYGLGSKTIQKLVVRGDSLYAGTMGAGIFVRDLKLSGIWKPFNTGLYSNYSYSINSLENINGRLFTGAGISAYYYINDKNSSLWQEYKLQDYNSMVFYDFVEDNSNIYSAVSLGLTTSSDSGLSFSLTKHNIGAVHYAGTAILQNNIYTFFTKSTVTYWFKSVDEGRSLELIDSQPGIFVLSSIVLGDRLYAGRTDGLWFIDPKITNIDGEFLPEAFELSQNYPNPFNPSTTIRYNIPAGETLHATSLQHISLKIFDMLGREVATLVNEEQQPGYYEVKFDGSEIASGIYLYKLQAGSFSSTKKLMLLK